MITKKRFIVDLLDDDNNNETEQFIRKYGADEITGMTNGDVIKALFPSDVVLKQSLMKSWWNTPYKAESENKG